MCYSTEYSIGINIAMRRSNLTLDENLVFGADEGAEDLGINFEVTLKTATLSTGTHCCIEVHLDSQLARQLEVQVNK